MYEFHAEHDIWFPSYAELTDGRFVIDNRLLISTENLPTGVSIGLKISDEEYRLPRLRAVTGI